MIEYDKKLPIFNTKSCNSKMLLSSLQILFWPLTTLSFFQYNILPFLLHLSPEFLHVPKETLFLPENIKIVYTPTKDSAIRAYSFQKRKFICCVKQNPG